MMLASHQLLHRAAAELRLASRQPDGRAQAQRRLLPAQSLPKQRVLSHNLTNHLCRGK